MQVFFATNCYGLFAYVMWSVMLLPLRMFSPSVYRSLESLLFKGLQSFIILWMGTGRYRVFESGDDVSKLSEEEVLLLCNHQSTADTPLVMMVLWGKGGCMARSMWVVDRLFHFTNFGLVCALRGDFFIKQGRKTRDQQGAMLKAHLRHSYLPLHRKWLVLFPEGGFLYKRLEGSQRGYARRQGLPVLRNVALPRLGALQAVLGTVGCPHDNADSDHTADGPGNRSSDPDRPMKWLVDMTIGYRNTEGGAPDMLGYREQQDIHVHYRAYAVSHIPRSREEELQKWIYDRYVEKDGLLDHLNKHGHFPGGCGGGVLPERPGEEVGHDWARVGLFQLLYAGSAYLHYSCVLQPLLSLLWW
ncbi:hypothetical protein ACOMHN_024398 [Nucella lapillus]